MSRRTFLGSGLVLAAIASACGSATPGEAGRTAPAADPGPSAVAGPAPSPVAGTTGAATSAPAGTPARPAVITPDLIRGDSPYLFHAYVKVGDAHGGGFHDLSNEWYGPGNRAFRTEALPLYGHGSEGPYIYAGDGSHVMRSRLQVEGSEAFIRAASVPYWQAGRIAALVLDAMATSPETLQQLKETPGWSLEQRSTGFVVHLALPFSEYGDTTPVQVSVVDAVTLGEARQRGLFEHGLAPTEGTKSEVEPGTNPGRITAWWLGEKVGDRTPGLAWYQAIDHPTPDDEAASIYTVVYLDAAARREDLRRRGEPWPELPDDGRIDGSVVVRTSRHPRVARCYPGQSGKLETATLSDGTKVVVSIQGDRGLSSTGSLCVAAADWKIDVTAPGQGEGDLRSLLSQLAPIED